jgi:hypothetical protein
MTGDRVPVRDNGTGYFSCVYTSAHSRTETLSSYHSMAVQAGHHAKHIQRVSKLGTHGATPPVHNDTMLNSAQRHLLFDDITQSLAEVV